jgi:hypothetical protein
VGGLDVFRPYIKAYIKKFSGNVVTTEEWRAHLYEFFRGQEKGDVYVKKLDEIKWDEVSVRGSQVERFVLTPLAVAPWVGR